MTKRDHILIANVLFQFKPKTGTKEYLLWQRILLGIGIALETNDPNFKRDFFNKCARGKA